MAKQPITISWDELKTRKVDQRVKEQQAIGRNRAYAQLRADELPEATPSRGSLLNSTLFCLTVLGVVGGTLAWTCGLLVHIKSGEQQAAELIQGIRRIELQRHQGAIAPAAAEASISLLRAEGKHNPYFAILSDTTLSPGARAARLNEIQQRAKLKRFVLNVIGFGLSGMLLALCLGVAEPLSERNTAAAVRNGALGAVMGLLGGVVVSLFVDKLYRAVGGGAVDLERITLREVLARALAWGILGLFLTAGPGVLMRNPKKLLIGMAGGLVGGAIGGALFDPVERLAGPELSRLVALIAIGAVSGASTGIIENVAKTGWLKVTAGLIAGKQFILYRSPTYIGSSPDCQIYLFRDPKVGRRHAALHLVGGGIELEDLPLGTPTLVNGNAISRARLHHGDQLAIGNTMFIFQEKTKR
jgi:hypothetical protein